MTQFSTRDVENKFSESECKKKLAKRVHSEGGLQL